MRMGFTRVHTDLMFSALDFFLEDDTPIRIFREDIGISFETSKGNSGIIFPNLKGNWDVVVEGLKVYEIENEVYFLITHEGNTLPVDEYIERLKQISISELQEKSKKFITMTKRGIEFLALQGKINLKRDFSYGPYFVFKDKFGNKRILIMN